MSEQLPGLLAMEIGKDVLFGCESTNSRTETLAKSCVLMSVKREDEDKDADENVDVDQTSTKRLVSEQPTAFWIATCSCETNRELPCSRTREEDRESLESRDRPLRLWTSLERKRIQPQFSSMAIGRNLNPSLRHQERATSKCSARQN